MEHGIEPVETAVRPGRKLDKRVILACFVVAVGVTFVARGLLVSVTGDDRAHLPAAVESVAPVPEAVQAFSGTSVFVDLVTGYTGELAIDGVTIESVNINDVPRVPGQQVDLPLKTIYEPGNATLTFTPEAGAPIDEFPDGQHTVRLTYWPLAEGRQSARTYTWTFTVV